MLVALVPMVLGACKRQGDSKQASTVAKEQVVRAATAALMPFKKQLKAALLAGLAKGPEEALGACKDQAPRITAKAQGPGISLGRTSHRLRNPANAPPQWVRPILDRYVAGKKPLGEPTVQRLGDGRWGVVEPIVLQPMCTTCHGKQIAPSVARRLRELYPQDQATGFEPGDLRGVFWVTLTDEAVARLAKQSDTRR